MSPNNIPGSQGGLKKVGAAEAVVTPSAVRATILREHELLRGDLVKIETELQSFEKDASTFKPDQLFLLIDEFSARFLTHLDLEEKLLRPVLETVDGWGSVRIEHLDQEHQLQREEIADLVASSKQRDAAALSKHLKIFIPELREDMGEEEEEFLHADLLRDDVITITQGS